MTLERSLRASVYKCIGFGGWLWGHDYRPRYSVHESTPESPYNSFGWTTLSDEVMKMYASQTREYKKTYEGDVCWRCGDVINKPEHHS